MTERAPAMAEPPIPSLVRPSATGRSRSLPEASGYRDVGAQAVDEGGRLRIAGRVAQGGRPAERGRAVPRLGRVLDERREDVARARASLLRPLEDRDR